MRDPLPSALYAPPSHVALLPSTNRIGSCATASIAANGAAWNRKSVCSNLGPLIACGLGFWPRDHVLGWLGACQSSLGVFSSASWYGIACDGLGDPAGPRISLDAELVTHRARDLKVLLAWLGAPIRRRRAVMMCDVR